jgi:crotonobetainyl-CoA:carnitine CoA-transferase CaiB-like acyl-CoA transferase
VAEARDQPARSAMMVGDPPPKETPLTAVMQGFRVLEVAEHTFVPAASALLSDWGAEVIKIEHVERGDAMRGLASSGLALFGTKVHVLLEHSNRGKRSLALDLTTDEGLEILYRLAGTCDVFLTNKLPNVRTKLKIDVEDIRAHNPNIVYVRGTGQGERGPEASNGSYDSLAYWNRAGIAMGIKQPDDDDMPPPPAPAFGDSIGAMTIAGGIMGALLHRERTGEATTVDVSLLGVGLWSMGAAMALSMQLEVPWGPMGRGTSTGNPLIGTFRTSDGRFVSLSCLQAIRYWAEACELLGFPEMATDVRFSTHESISANAAEATDLVRAAFAEHTAAEWSERLENFSGQWVLVQNTLQAVTDRQTVANGYIGDCQTAEGDEFKLVTAPVQFGGEPSPVGRAPEFNEHGDAILEELGYEWETVVDLKVRGVIA